MILCAIAMVLGSHAHAGMLPIKTSILLASLGLLLSITQWIFQSSIKTITFAGIGMMLFGTAMIVVFGRQRTGLSATSIGFLITAVSLAVELRRPGNPDNPSSMLSRWSLWAIICFLAAAAVASIVGTAWIVLFQSQPVFSMTLMPAAHDQSDKWFFGLISLVLAGGFISAMLAALGMLKKGGNGVRAYRPSAR